LTETSGIGKGGNGSFFAKIRGRFGIDYEKSKKDYLTEKF
jgi:hypothetical protein